jgi:hypothetical protein
LWVIAALAAAAVAVSSYLSTETRLARYHLARCQARAWAKAGVLLAMQRLASDAMQPEDASQPELAYDWLGDDWAVPPDDARQTDPSRWHVEMAPIPGMVPGAHRVVITVKDEERLLPLSKALLDVDIVKSLLEDPEAAQALVEYQDTMKKKIVVLEEAWALPPFQARPELKAVLEEHVSPYTEGPVNINTITADVWKAIVHDPAANALIEAIAQGRERPEQAATSCYATSKTTAAQELADCARMGDVMPVSQLLNSLDSVVGFDVQSSTFSIVAEGIAGLSNTDVRYRIGAIVQRNPASPETMVVGGAPFRVVAWRELR